MADAGHAGQVQAGENVMIWGGVGGLGVMAIQICRLYGANPIPVVGGAAKVKRAQELGAEMVIDRSRRTSLPGSRS